MVSPINFEYSVIDHEHTIIKSLTTINPGTPFLILIVYQIAYIMGFRLFFPGRKLRNDIKNMSLINDIKFFEALSDEHK